ncbi:hypothetical protein [Caudoviricetes sp.]|nr:hypothetical protein [Caudoviricetes sp.]
MLDVIDDGINNWVILLDDCLIGRIQYSRQRGMFRAVCQRGQLSHHYTFTAALDAIKGE